MFLFDWRFVIVVVICTFVTSNFSPINQSDITMFAFGWLLFAVARITLLPSLKTSCRDIVGRLCDKN